MSHRRARIVPEVVAWVRVFSLFEKIRLIVVFPCVLMLAAGCQREAPPSHIFHNGKIVTVDPQFRIVEAMAIRDGRILAVGSERRHPAAGRLRHGAGSISPARPCCRD